MKVHEKAEPSRLLVGANAVSHKEKKEYGGWSRIAGSKPQDTWWRKKRDKGTEECYGEKSMESTRPPSADGHVFR